MAESIWAVVEAAATALAAVFAGAQIRLSRRDANARAVFEHLREIDHRVTAASHSRISDAQDDVLAYYRGQRADLTTAAAAYMSLLNSLDVLAFAIAKHLVDKSVAEEYLRTLLSPNVISQTFLKDLQSCCGDSHVYEHLYRQFGDVQWGERAGGQLGTP